MMALGCCRSAVFHFRPHQSLLNLLGRPKVETEDYGSIVDVVDVVGCNYPQIPLRSLAVIGSYTWPATRQVPPCLAHT